MDSSTSASHFQGIVESIPDLISTIDPDGTVSYVSPSATRALGFSAEELIGSPFAMLVHPDELALARSVIGRQLSKPDAVGSLNARIADSSLTWRWYSIVASNRVVDGKVANVIVHARDITACTLRVAQLERSNRINSLGRLAASVAHEFNNVLMGMQPFAELIQRPNVSADVVSRSAMFIISAIGRGKRAALEILRFTQPAPPVMKRIFVEDWWHQQLPKFETGAHSLDWNIQPDLAVSADCSQLTKVVSNLISNARDASMPGDRITVRARRPKVGETFLFGAVPHAESYVQISVSDNGSGIPADILGHVFDPLFTTKSNGNTGLGLSIVHQIIANHGGAVFIESEPDLGTTVHTFFRAAEK